jgi:hypothetical protein
MSYHLFETDADLPEGVTRDEVDFILAVIDSQSDVQIDFSSFVPATDEELEAVNNKFLGLLAKDEPNHPWVLAREAHSAP